MSRLISACILMMMMMMKGKCHARTTLTVCLKWFGNEIVGLEQAALAFLVSSPMPCTCWTQHHLFDNSSANLSEYFFCYDKMHTMASCSWCSVTLLVGVRIYSGLHKYSYPLNFSTFWPKTTTNRLYFWLYVKDQHKVENNCEVKRKLYIILFIYSFILQIN